MAQNAILKNSVAMPPIPFLSLSHPFAIYIFFYLIKRIRVKNVTLFLSPSLDISQILLSLRLSRSLTLSLLPTIKYRRFGIALDNLVYQWPSLIRMIMIMVITTTTVIVNVKIMIMMMITTAMIMIIILVMTITKA